MAFYDVFFITSEWQDEGNQHQLVVYGRSPQLGCVTLVFDQAKPVFFVDRSEALPAIDFPIDRKPVPLTDYAGNAVDAVYFRTQRELRQAADRFKATGVRHYEADVRPEERFLMERFIMAAATVMGEPEISNGMTLFTNPKLKPARVKPALRIASLDIETGVSQDLLFSIAVQVTGGGSEERRVFMLADRHGELPDNLTLFPSESELLTAFFQWFRQADPDLIIGWHVIGFDLMYLERKCADLGLNLDLARNNRKVLLVDKPGAGYFATISGRVVVDGPPTLRANGFTFSNYRLETIAQKVLGSGKLIAAKDTDKVREIERLFREDKPSLARYNLEDCLLVTRIFAKLEIIPLLIERVTAGGGTIDALGIPTAPLDRLYLPRLHRKGMVAPMVEEAVKDSAEILTHGLETRPGIYQDVLAFDHTSLYPALAATFGIDPLARIKAGVNPIQTPGGLRFSASEHILPDELLRILEQRRKADEDDDKIAAKAFDMLLENLCATMASPKSRFFHPDLAAALKSCGTWLGVQYGGFLESRGFTALYGDTTTLLVAVGNQVGADLDHLGRQLAQELGSFCSSKLKASFGVASGIQFRFGQRYKKLFLPRARTTAEQDQKRFAGIPVGATADQIQIEGMAFTSSDWTSLARHFQAELMVRFFQDQPLEPWVLDFIQALRDGRYNDRLVYQKRLKKGLDEYGKSAPPQVKAARMLKNPGRFVNYVFTKRGPLPVELEPSDYDYEHYIEKQLQPIADPLLECLGKSFKSISQPQQIELF